MRYVLIYIGYLFLYQPSFNFYDDSIKIVIRKK